jgi:hypothetical protein
MRLCEWLSVESSMAVLRLEDVHLPEGAAVTVLIPDGEQTFEADPEMERMLLESIAQSDRREKVPLAKLIEDLRSRE